MAEERPRRRVDLASLVLALVFALKLAVVLGAVGRGFEMGDEGYFLLNLNHPEAALPPLEIYRVIGAVCGGCRIGVVEARLLRIAAELLGSLALVAGVFVWARAWVFAPGAVGFPAFLAWCGLGTLLSVASRSFGYNDMTNLFSFAVVGALFHLASLPPAAARRRAVSAVAAGALTGIQLAVKFPPALLLAVFVTVMLAVGLRALAWRERASLLAGYAGGALAMVAFVVWVTGGAPAMAERLAVASRLPALTNYHPMELLARYVQVEILSLWNGAIFLAVFALVYRRSLRRDPARRERARVRALAVASLVLLACSLRFYPPFLSWTLVALCCLVVGLALVLLVLHARERRDPERAPERRGNGTTALPLLLFVLPFALIAGTNVPITMRLPTHVLPLFALLALFVLDWRSRETRPRFHRVVAGVLVASSAMVFVQHHWFHPYGLRQSIARQGSDVAGLPGLRVDLAAKIFLETTASTLAGAGFQRGDPVIAFDYTPGLVYYLGGTSPRYNLYMFDLTTYNCVNWNRAGFRKPPFVILARPMPPAQSACLEGFRFPEDFRLLRTLRFPYEEVYAGFGAPGFSHVYLYGPRETRAPQGR